MIIAIIGDIGSGKTVTGVKTIAERDNPSFVNFSVKHKKAERIKREYIIKDHVVRTNKLGREIKEKRLNWDFWRQQGGGFDIYLDEVHNVIHARMAMSKHNVLMTQWLSQIRKILGSSEKNHIFLISQKISRIDIAFRDLINMIIYCRKFKFGERLFVLNYYFSGEDCLGDFHLFRQSQAEAARLKKYRLKYFLANPYFKFYDSYEIVDFGDDVYL